MQTKPIDPMDIARAICGYPCFKFGKCIVADAGGKCSMNKHELGRAEQAFTVLRAAGVEIVGDK
jgi:hypothetical protein